MALAAKQSDAADTGYWFTLELDGEDVPSDWYPRIAGEITPLREGESKPSEEIPR